MVISVKYDELLTLEEGSGKGGKGGGGGVKVSMLTHTYQHKPLKKILSGYMHSPG